MVDGSYNSQRLDGLHHPVGSKWVVGSIEYVPPGGTESSTPGDFPPQAPPPLTSHGPVKLA